MQHAKILFSHPKARLPSRATNGSAGYDLYAVERVEIQPGQQAKLPTGVHISCPVGTYARIAPRSGLAVKHAINVHAGVIDPDYTGEINVALINHGPYMVEFKPGDRIAQLIFERYETPDFLVTESLDATQRADGGFGHSGR